MKSYFLKVMIAFAFIIFIQCEGTSESSKKGLSFEQVGYFKNDTKLRYFTFWVKSDTLLKPVSLSKEVLDEIRTHGSSQMNTSGQITASFCYLDKNQVPDITNLNAESANSVAHDNKPIVSVWIMPTGQVNVIENP